MPRETDNEPITDITTTDGRPPYFAYSASLRIFGDIDDLAAISRKLGVNPTSMHRRGEKPGDRSPVWKHDMWRYQAPVGETHPLSEHIQSLLDVERGKEDYLLQLKNELQVDVFCGFRTNCWGAGFEVSPEALALFTTLRVPFGVSVIVA
jgi:uncharacterized protein DUF4279